MIHGTSRAGSQRTSASKACWTSCTISGSILSRAGRNTGLQVLRACTSPLRYLFWTRSGAGWMRPLVLSPLPRTSVPYWKAISQERYIPYGNTAMPCPYWIQPNTGISVGSWKMCIRDSSRIDRKIYYKKEDILNYMKRDLKTCLLYTSIILWIVVLYILFL